MKWFANIPDAECDRLLKGQAPDDSGLGDVAEFLADLGSVYPDEPTAPYEAMHVASMLEAVSVLAENGGATEVSATTGREVRPARQGRAPVFARLGAHKWASATALSVAALLAFSGAAHAGVLPAPIQRATADFVRQVGITIPAPQDATRANPVGPREDAPSTSGTGTNGGGSSAGSGAAGGTPGGRATGIVTPGKATGAAKPKKTMKSVGSSSKASASNASAKAKKHRSVTKKPKPKAKKVTKKGDKTPSDTGSSQRGPTR
jgi:hypothetical protein